MKKERSKSADVRQGPTETDAEPRFQPVLNNTATCQELRRCLSQDINRNGMWDLATLKTQDGGYKAVRAGAKLHRMACHVGDSSYGKPPVPDPGATPSYDSEADDRLHR